MKPDLKSIGPETAIEGGFATSAPAGDKKLFVKSYGCQMNVYDAARMADVLAPEGYTETAVMEEADLIVLNTCHIREKAADKVFSELGKVRVLKEARAAAGRTTKIAVAGCVAQAEGAEILRKQRAVDLVVGPQSYHRLPELLRQSALKPVIDTDFPVEDKFDHLAQPSDDKTRERGISAFLTVQEGCDKFCAFCVVPYTRGAENSRPPAKIIAEAENLARAGVREITLLGQNVNGYHGEGDDGRDWSLAELLFRLSKIEGIVRLRYMTDEQRVEHRRAAHVLLPDQGEQAGSGIYVFLLQRNFVEKNGVIIAKERALIVQESFHRKGRIGWRIQLGGRIRNSDAGATRAGQVPRCRYDRRRSKENGIIVKLDLRPLLFEGCGGRLDRGRAGSQHRGNIVR